MRALVTGGFGFVGSHLVDLLYELGHDVTVVDDLSANVVSPSAYLCRCRFFAKRIEDFDGGSHSFDAVFHLASPVGPIRILKLVGTITSRIISATKAAIRIATDNGCRLTYVSSSDVYSTGGWLSESASIVPNLRLTARAEYARGKWQSEMLLQEFAVQTGLPYDIVRPFNVAGARQEAKAGFVIARFLRSALSGQDVQVFGTGLQLRCFMHVNEVARACLAITESTYSNEVWNVGNPENLTPISDLARTVVERLQSSSRITYIDPVAMFGPAFDDGFSKLPVVEKIAG